MKCYYQGLIREADNKSRFNGFVSFAVPEIGIKFRGQYHGSFEETEYASLLALLEFIELNAHLFKDRRLEIFGNNVKIISQVNNEISPSDDLEAYCALARDYKRKIPYILNWIPRTENMAQDSLPG